MARPRNPRVGDSSEVLATIGTGDTPSLEHTLARIDLADLPDHLKMLPPRAVEVLCLRARGVTYAQIGRRLGISKECCVQYVSEYDPQGIFITNPELRAKLAVLDWEIAQAQAISIAIAGADELSPMQAVTMAGIAADKLRDIKRLQMEDKRIDMVVDNSSLAGLRAIDIESSEAEPA